jgi:hypothetical protein
MGLFDYILVQFPLPETAPNWIDKDTEWQTKDTDAQFLETYIITKEGRLIHQTVEYESVPEEERPYYGKPEWEKSSFAKFCGIIRSVPTGDVDTNFHGDLHIGATSREKPYRFYDAVVRFNNGQLQYIKEIKEDKQENN